jgi:hypothetical protein
MNRVESQSLNSRRVRSEVKTQRLCGVPVSFRVEGEVRFGSAIRASAIRASAIRANRQNRALRSQFKLRSPFNVVNRN